MKSTEYHVCVARFCSLGGTSFTTTKVAKEAVEISSNFCNTLKNSCDKNRNFYAFKSSHVTVCVSKFCV